jgi:prepilin-type N-terminal cleavage/methylation domain-containing protein
MNAKRGFTLAEMLAVVGIMLVLMVAAFGVFSTFAQRAGPDNAVSTIQAMLNGARDYAAANGVWAAVTFNADRSKPEDGTTMRLCYKAVDSGATGTWTEVRGRSAVTLGENMFACKDLPSITVPNITVADARNEAQVLVWKKQVEIAITGATGTLTNDVKTKLDNYRIKPFYAVYDPSGCLTTTAGGMAANADYVTTGLTVVNLMPGDTPRVIAYSLYPLNSMSGTRLVFEF